MQRCNQDSPYGRPVPQPYQLYGAGQGNSADTGRMMPERDLEYFQNLYPDKMKRIQRYVNDTCDKLDYKNSFIYDEYPDKMMIDKACVSICQRIVCENGECTGDYARYMEPAAEAAEQVTEVEEVEAYEATRIQNLPPWGPPPRPPYPPEPPWGPPPRPPMPPRPPRPPMPPWGPPPRPPYPPEPPWGPPSRPPYPPEPPWGPPSRPPYGSNWMNDVVKIMFLNEMFNRRCKSGRCY